MRTVSRKQKVSQECSQYLKKIKHGSQKTKETRQSLLKLIVRDLLELKCLPASISHLKPEHIDLLIQYWREKKYCLGSICNRVSVIRLLNETCELGIVLPNNAELGISWKPAESANPFENIEIPHVQHPAVQTAIDFQTGFGLTRFEAFKIDLTSAFQETVLFIHRNVATNKKGRAIPILTKEQRRFIDARKKVDAKTLHPLKNLLPGLYRSELSYLGINPTTPFRKIYIQERYQTLIETKDHDASIQSLLSETGVSSKYKLSLFLEGVWHE